MGDRLIYIQYRLKVIRAAISDREWEGLDASIHNAEYKQLEKMLKEGKLYATKF